MNRILIDYSEKYVRYAYMEDSELLEIIVESRNQQSILGNIYVGVVKNILAGGFAFIDVGLEKNVFVNITDSKEKAITDHLKTGQEILVQIVNEACGDKGAAATTQIGFSGIQVALFKNIRGGVGVSKKITEKAEKKRLKEIAARYIPEGYGAVIRTASAHKDEKEIVGEINKLLKNFKKIDSKWKYIKAPSLIHSENKAIKDLLNNNVDEILINDKRMLNEIKNTVDGYIIGFGQKVGMYKGDLPMFTEYSVDSAVKKALSKKVWLSSGGFIIIEQTEAFVVIDVNTGKSTGKRNHTETVLRTNIEAAGEISRQLRLRNLSGMIVIDFINMSRQSDTAKLRKELSQELAKDRLPVVIVGFTKLGLMQLTRKKTREPLNYVLRRECPLCGGLGLVDDERYYV